MPAYTTFQFSFLKEDLYPKLVEDFYQAIQVEEVSFDKVFAWGCSENTSLEEIIEWNQEKIDSNFRLGYTEDVSNGFRQILLKWAKTYECRIFISNDSNNFSFHLIIPEGDIYDSDNHSTLRKMLLSVVEKMPVYTVQSYDEISDSATVKQLKNGVLPTIEYFGYVPSFIHKRLSNKLSNQVKNGYFVEW